MFLRTVIQIALSGFMLTVTQAPTASQPSYRYFKTGESADVSTKTAQGFALMGGGKDQDAGLICIW